MSIIFVSKILGLFIHILVTQAWSPKRIDGYYHDEEDKVGDVTQDYLKMHDDKDFYGVKYSTQGKFLIYKFHTFLAIPINNKLTQIDEELDEENKKLKFNLKDLDKEGTIVNVYKNILLKNAGIHKRRYASTKAQETTIRGSGKSADIMKKQTFMQFENK